jgi:hypothetical protein
MNKDKLSIDRDLLVCSVMVFSAINFNLKPFGAHEGGVRTSRITHY